MNVVNEVFNTCTKLALEDWGMMLIEPVTASRDIFTPHNNLYVGSMHFQGVMGGAISILCDLTFMQILSANVLGSESPTEINEKEGTDALKELTNVLSGNFLTEAYGDDTVFELVYPQVKKASQEILDRFFSNKLIQYFVADDQPVAVALGTMEIF